MADISLISNSMRDDLDYFFKGDDLLRNLYYLAKLPEDKVNCSLKFKDDMIIAGIPYFIEAFKYLGANLSLDDFLELEGKRVVKNDNYSFDFKLPFALALTGERIALNLLQHCSSIATYTDKFVKLAAKKKISILDTRKTTPGLRTLEKYAVRIGGGYNHRFGQTDVWMVKDNHKNYFGGLKNAVDFFKSMGGFYTPIEVEIHSLEELQEAIQYGVKIVMLDNFSPKDIKEAVKIKPDFMIYEVSGGIQVDNIETYLIKGVDAISAGAITYNAPNVDISLKYEKDNT